MGGLLAAVGLALAGCGSSGGKQADAGTAAAGVAETPRLKVAMITREVPGDRHMAGGVELIIRGTTGVPRH